jgi:hypothetical protein
MGVAIFISIIHSMFKRKLDESRILRWFPLGILALVGGIFPQLMEKLLQLSGLGENPNYLIQALIILFLLTIVFNNAGEISQLRATKNELGMQASILNAEIKRLTEITATLAESIAEPGDMDLIRRLSHEGQKHESEQLGV